MNIKNEKVKGRYQDIVGVWRGQLIEQLVRNKRRFVLVPSIRGIKREEKVLLERKFSDGREIELKLK